MHHSQHQSQAKSQPPRQPCQQASASDPLCCPPLKSALASEHPRVYLLPDSQGLAVCPYCGACYQAA